VEYLLHILILIGIYVILSVSLNLIAGVTGILSIAHAAFYGVGAYVAALMALRIGGNFWFNVICAIVLAALLGLLVGIPGLRIRGDYFVIATFAFQTIVFSILNNWVSFTGGPMGLPGIPRPEPLGWEITSHVEFLVLVGMFSLVTILVARRLVNSPFGRVLLAIREDEIFTESLAKNVTGFKVTVFMIGAGLAAVAGVMYAYYISFIDPTSFTVMESIFIISIVIIGGTENLWGPVVGAAVLVTLPELLRFVGMPNSIAANVRQILYGGLLIVFMLWRPQGLIGKRAFKRVEVEGS
jgi:branched-chain amino acid transport system permease protein